MANAISFGYVNADGTNDAVIVSPATGVTGTALRDLVVAAWNGTGNATPVWVDGTPANLVALVAAKLGIPSGTPSDWFPRAEVDEDVAAPAMNRAARRAAARVASHVHRFEFKGLDPRFGSARRFVCACGASQIRAS